MKRKKQQKQYLIYVFILLVLGIGLGYALLQSDLNINGLADIGNNSWDIHFNNIQVTEGSVSATTPATINQSDNTKVNYSILLEKPGDFYEFTVDIVNAGTLPGTISLYSVTGIDPTYENIIEYSINYTNGNPMQVGDILNDGYTKTIKVRTYFNSEIDADDLLEDDFNLNLVLNITYIQSDEREVTAGNILQNLKNEGSSCITKYNGQVTDQVGQTVTATNVYFDKCADKRNVIFGGFCWQIIRSTETGGLKMIYNGEPVNGKCESNRGDHKGIVQSNRTSQNIASSYLYGSSFTYNTSTNEFTLVDTTTATWSDSTYENLIGKFTCMSSSNTCSTVYQINTYNSSTEANLSYYTITATKHVQIGKSSYNASSGSLAMVGYMFNKVYNSKGKSPGTNTYKFGNTFTYNTANNTYTLAGTTQDISNWSTGYNSINNTHYTCWNVEGSCATISYVSAANSSYVYYLDISGGKNVGDLLNEMLWNNDVNTYNSSIKGIIDAWYAQNLSTKTIMLEDTVFCNARNISTLAGWNPNGGSTSTSSPIRFKNYVWSTSMICPNETDQFAVSNGKAKLTYPVGLLLDEERYNINIASLMVTNYPYWGISPYTFYHIDARVRGVGWDGNEDYSSVADDHGVRPVVSLARGTVISEGSGSKGDPWIVE